MLQTLKFKVVGLVCIVATIVVLVLALPAAPLGLLFWLISMVGAAIERVGSWLLDLVYAYLERLRDILNRIDDVATETENQAKKRFRDEKFKELAQPRRR
jgi:hypothetical protein